MQKARGYRRDIVERIQKDVEKAFAQAKLQAQIFGREKTLYSIYTKMLEKHLTFAQVNDIFGFRIVVGTLPECYMALGVLHQLMKPVPGRFKDYIAIPKANGYQSLHTTLVSPLGTAVEFQIRTEPMHAVAEKGIAAHWLYKEHDDGPVPRPARRSGSARSGCSRCSTSRTRRATPASSSSTSRSTSIPTRSTCSRRRRRSWPCRAARRRSTSPTRSTPTSATTASPPTSTASRCRCAPN